MRRLVVLLTLSLGFIAPLAVSVAEAADAQVLGAWSRNTDCRRKRAAKKPQGEAKKKGKGGKGGKGGKDGKTGKDGKDGKKPYGFEL
jgi:hypothetical protein